MFINVCAHGNMWGIHNVYKDQFTNMRKIEKEVITMFTRSPILVLLAHVDHGKTSIIDSIRGSNVAKKEAGAITQMIGASYVTKNTLDALSKNLAEKMRVQLKIPGLLFIDTPGHEAFTNLRDRGGSIADMAILVVDVTQGFQPQTLESIRILKQYKTPFVIAANKIDLVHGWKSYKTQSFLESFSKQPEHIQQKLDEKLYEIMGKISEHGFDSERFDRITDFKKQLAIIPMSAKTKEGLAELLVLIAGLSQTFLEGKLEIEETGRGKASVIEVKEEKGMGTTIDVILYDGVLQKNDEIIFLSQNGIEKTKIRGLLLPDVTGKEKFKNTDSVVAAAGVKILAPGLEKTLPGSPLEVVKDFEKDKKELEKQFKDVLFESKDEGVILKADSLGSAEALVKLLEDSDIKVKNAGVGKITHRDILAAKAVSESNKFYGTVLGFNVQILDEAREGSKNTGVPIIWSNIIYKVLDQYEEWVKEEKEHEKRKALAKYPLPGKIKVLEGYCFRACKPAIFGVKIEKGTVKKGCRLMRSDNEIVGEIKEIQYEKEKVDEAKTGQEVAISCEGIHYGKNVEANDTLYIYLDNEAMEKWEKQKSILSGDEKEVFEELKQMRKKYF